MTNSNNSKACSYWSTDIIYKLRCTFLNPQNLGGGEGGDSRLIHVTPE